MSVLAKSIAALCLAAVAGVAFAAPSDGVLTTFPGPDNLTLDAVVYKPDNVATRDDWPAIVMLHGCSGMWSNSVFGASNGGVPNLQKHIESWGRYLADHGYIAIAVDSFHARGDAQTQCGGQNLTDPYTERVQDARAAYTYLANLGEVNPLRVGLLAWSQGAQSAMVEASETVYNATTLRPETDHLFEATAVFYPGCGSAMKFGTPASGWWRPHRDFLLSVGAGDSFRSDCDSRVTRARTVYGATAGTGHEASIAIYAGADHSFDHDGRTDLGMPDTSFPTSAHFAYCMTSGIQTEACAMVRADWATLTFFNHRLQ
jgi:dienelactone hydrolase